MAVNLSPVGGVAAQFFDNDGNVLSGGLIYTYVAGSTTPQTTYTTGAGNIAHSNPIVLDSAGRVPTGEIWLTDSLVYKFVIKDSTGALIGTYDNIVGINSNFVNYTASQEIQTATAGQTVFTLTTMAYQPGTNSLSVFVDGVNQYGPGAQYAFTETSSTSVTFNDGLHVGASVKFTTAVINNVGGVDASQVTYDPPFTGSVTTNVEAKLAQTVSVKDFGAVGDGVTDDTAAIQAACDAGGIGSTVFIPKGVYYVDGTITKYAGQTLQGEGWATVSGSFAVEAGTSLVQHNISDIDLISVIGLDDDHQKERGGLKNLALVHSVSGSTVGTAYNATYARQQVIDNVYITGFRTGLYFGPQVWMSNVQNTRIADAKYCLVCNSSSEDNVFINCQFAGYRIDSVGVWLRNQSANTTFITCYMENCKIGAFLDQGDSNGDGTGVPYPMHATFVGCLIENIIDAAFILTSTNQSASASLHPGLTLIHPRLYIGNGWASATPNNGQSIIYALSASQISVQDVFAQGFSYGGTFGMSAYGFTYVAGIVGPVLWGLDNNAVYGTSRFRGQLNNLGRVFGGETAVALNATALAYTAFAYATVPFTAVVSDPYGWSYAVGKAIKPFRGGQLVRFYAQILVSSANAGRYVLYLYKNGSQLATLFDQTVSPAANPLTLAGEFWDTPNGSTDQYTVVVYSSQNFTLDTSASATRFYANLIGN